MIRSLSSIKKTVAAVEELGPKLDSAHAYRQISNASIDIAEEDVGQHTTILNTNAVVRRSLQVQALLAI